MGGGKKIGRNVFRERKSKGADRVVVRHIMKIDRWKLIWPEGDPVPPEDRMKKAPRPGNPAKRSKERPGEILA